MRLSSIISRWGQQMGFDIRRYPTRLLRNRSQLLQTQGIDLILDVGANKGQYAQELRSIGYQGEIYSFEPLAEAYGILANAAAKDPLWKVFNYGLGLSEETISINVASNLASSSILEFEPSHKSAAPNIGYLRKESISIKALDEVAPSLKLDGRKVFLKIDTQGYEEKVLKGASNTLQNHITGLQIELSLTPVYTGEWLYEDIILHLKQYGYELYSMEPGLCDENTGRMLQFDGVFFRSKED
ncbi:FkbM family methyltransferase [Neolewinella lacunae]|uniref:FkbM family methyltransferase n=1 Tax=Neolewinella lacunae TaxID=1517758 RepID=A0A923T837_9BACT|nr:FkbM family methyltransferase [Neolewinella lacunae]MBC6994164.1 FkbM family methyltransferase [Neolewinella lacunae]MDN3636687.1 FkbM family methyltransferase [Neolewinella lacunae]